MSDNKDLCTKEDYKELKKKFREERKQEKKQNRVDKKIEKIENKLANLRAEEGRPVEEKKEEHHHHHHEEEKREEHPVDEKKVYYAYRSPNGETKEGAYYAYREQRQPGITRKITIRPANYIIVDKHEDEAEKQSDFSEEEEVPNKISVPLPCNSGFDVSPGITPDNEPERVPESEPGANTPVPDSEPKY